MPRLNKRKQKSNITQKNLELALMEAIEKCEKDNGYEFDQYEVDNVMLGMVKRNHERYLVDKFGSLMSFESE